MKVKKKAAKAVKKATKPSAPIKKKTVKKSATKKTLTKSTAVKKVVAKKHVAKKAKSSVRPAAKAKSSKAPSGLLKTAAQKLKGVFSTDKTKKSALKTPAAPSKPATKSTPVAKPVKAAAAVPMPKGLLAEDRIRKMSDKDYMGDAQLNFFRYRLLQMRSEVLAREIDVKERLHQREVFADPADRATAEEEHWLDLRLRERESLLLRKIDDALRRIADREFGYCEKTGDPIGIPRLLARPTATVCVDIKGQDERIESQFRDR